MKKLIKQILCVVLVVIFVISLAACSSSSSPKTDTTKTTTTAGASDSTGAESKEEDFAAKVSTYTLLAPLYVTDLPDIKKEELYEKIKKEFGIDWNITWVSSSDYTTKFQTVLSSGDITDVIVATNLLDTTLNQCMDILLI